MRAVNGANLALKNGRPFEEEQFNKAEGAIRRALTDRGYAYAKVKTDAAVDIVDAQGRRRVHGDARPDRALGDRSPSKASASSPRRPSVARPIDTEGAAPFSQQDLDRRAASAPRPRRLRLGLGRTGPARSRRARRRDRADHGRSSSRHVSARSGSAAASSSTRSRPTSTAIVGWESRNFLGGLRTFSVQFRPGVVLYPLRVNNIVAPNKFLPEERLRLEFRQPGFLEARTNALHPARVQHLPGAPQPDPPPDARVIGYAESATASASSARSGSSTARSRTTPGRLSVQRTSARRIRRSASSSSRIPSSSRRSTSATTRSTRGRASSSATRCRSPVSLRRSSRRLQGAARGPRLRPGRRSASSSRRADRSASSCRRTTAASCARPAERLRAHSEETTRDYQLTFFRGFFSGGPTSNRGYPIRGVGPHDIVPFLTPDVEPAQVNAECGRPSSTAARRPAASRSGRPRPSSDSASPARSPSRPSATRVTFRHRRTTSGSTHLAPLLRRRRALRHACRAHPARHRLPHSGLQVIGGLTPDEREPETFFGWHPNRSAHRHRRSVLMRLDDRRSRVHAESSGSSERVVGTTVTFVTAAAAAAVIHLDVARDAAPRDHAGERHPRDQFAGDVTSSASVASVCAASTACAFA